MSNVNLETGIRYGIISANALNADLIEDIQCNGVDLHYIDALEEVTAEVDADRNIAQDDKEDERSARMENYCDDEPVHQFDVEGVKGRTTWLGGALLVWIFESPFTTKAKLCSPCVPNCGDLDHLDTDGYECYDVPPDWRELSWGNYYE